MEIIHLKHWRKDRAWFDDDVLSLKSRLELGGKTDRNIKHKGKDQGKSDLKRTGKNGRMGEELKGKLKTQKYMQNSRDKAKQYEPKVKTPHA